MAIPLEVRVVILLVLFGAIVWHRIGLYFEERKQREALHQWINDNGLSEYETSLRKFGMYKNIKLPSNTFKRLLVLVFPKIFI